MDEFTNKYLYDILASIEDIESYFNERPRIFSEFCKNSMLHKAIERNIEIIGDYKNNSTKVKVRCKRCFYEWEVRPYSLLAGRGCPRCGRQSQASKRRKTD